MQKHEIHLLALSHVYLVPRLKHRCTKALAEQLTIENVVDMLQLARLCDTPDLYLKCMKFLRSNFRKVEKTEGWKFLQRHDSMLELEILQFMDEAESRLLLSFSDVISGFHWKFANLAEEEEEETQVGAELIFTAKRRDRFAWSTYVPKDVQASGHTTRNLAKRSCHVANLINAEASSF
ncbi:hypothetical protein RND71_010277 [Anisodus tanguticus]|uniref:Uncharacterized protein n=1 Tax=Anisodus tanguticus TaxID=243964 RepID=A0AAE1SK21_9SOLA|nr:hypothetical protein RND71_010277 [Anisodus tanguticus]